MTGLANSGLTLLVLASIAVSACASGPDQYPSLSLRDFERVEGQFAATDSASEPIRPAPPSAETAAQVATAMSEVRKLHEQFVEQAQQARVAVAAASGVGPEHKDWSSAMIAIAELDSRSGSTAGLLADLDKLYTAASLDFQQRDAIALAQAEVARYADEERQIIDGLTRQLPTAR